MLMAMLTLLFWHHYFSLPFHRSTYVSVLTIVAFSMERFLAICHPLHLYTMSGLHRAVRIIAALWVISFLSAVPFAVFTKIHYLNYPPSEFLNLLFCWINGFDLIFDFSQWKDPGFSVLCDAGQSGGISVVGSFDLCVLHIPDGHHDHPLWSDGTENQVENSTKCGARWVLFYNLHNPHRKCYWVAQ